MIRQRGSAPGPGPEGIRGPHADSVQPLEPAKHQLNRGGRKPPERKAEVGNRAGSAEFREPARPWTVLEGGRGQDRRPGPPGASPEDEACHEASANDPRAPLPVRPHLPPGPDSGAASREAAPAPGLRRLPAAGDREAQRDRPEEGRSAHAGVASPKRGRGRPPRKWVVRVRAAAPGAYAEFRRYLGHPCAGMTAEERLEGLSTLCARLWARTCQETLRQRHMAKEVNRKQLRKAA